MIEKLKFVGNKAKGRISKRVFQENKARQIFRKNERFLPPDTHAYVCVSGGKNIRFCGKFGVLCFLETPFLRFGLLPYYRRIAVTFSKIQENHSESFFYTKLQKNMQNLEALVRTCSVRRCS